MKKRRIDLFVGPQTPLTLISGDGLLICYVSHHWLWLDRPGALSIRWVKRDAVNNRKVLYMKGGLSDGNVLPDPATLWPYLFGSVARTAQQ
jgi:hypothetical protein